MQVGFVSLKYGIVQVVCCKFLLFEQFKVGFIDVCCFCHLFLCCVYGRFTIAAIGAAAWRSGGAYKCLGGSTVSNSHNTSADAHPADAKPRRFLLVVFF
jgi:hypothetical protein